MIVVHLGRLLGERRLRMADICRRSGISKKTLSLLYREKSSGIRFTTLAKLCAALGCSVGELLEAKPEPSPHQCPTPTGSTPSIP
jgi:putative transcriptional regulator